MPHFIIQTTRGTPLYDGHYTSLKHCVESAADQGIPLDQADLRRANLSNANLDDIRMRCADLSGANLSGANLSESWIDGSDLSGASLQNACFALANLRRCNFMDASFGATDISGADLRGAKFSTLSAFSLNFIDCAGMEEAIFMDPDGLPCPMTRPPVVLQGLCGSPLVFLDRHVRFNGKVMSQNAWLSTARLSSIPGHDPVHAGSDMELPPDTNQALLHLLQSVQRLRRIEDTDQSSACVRAASGLK